MVNKNIFEDIARLSTNVAASVFESARSVQDSVKTKMGHGNDNPTIGRDEFEVLKSMASRIRLENETMLKDTAEFKKQFQAITSSLDIIKQQISKSGTQQAAPSVDAKQIDELKKTNENINIQLEKFNSALTDAKKEIETLSTKLAEKISAENTEKTEKAQRAAKPKKETPPEPEQPAGLFDNE